MPINSDGEECDMWGEPLEDEWCQCDAMGPHGTGCVLREGHNGDHVPPEGTD